MAADFDLHHGKPVFFVEKSDTLNQPGQAFWRAVLGLVRVQARQEILELTSTMGKQVCAGFRRAPIYSGLSQTYTGPVPRAAALETDASAAWVFNPALLLG
ncbi:MAG TPA: hypothetical protein VL793_02070 [Patescibacteria group bacterium]|nr:hypothetical protein [Patescibacteria group bacterium]